MAARKKKSLKAPFLVTLAAATVACGGAIEKNSSTDCSISGTCITNPPGPTGRAASCPATSPEDGDSCGAEDEGLSCEGIDMCNATGVTPARTVTCSNGRWSGPARTYRVACPPSPPDSGASCSTCVGAYPTQCAYGGSSPPCGPSVVATCDESTGKWKVGSVTCNPPPVPVDAGADGG